MIDLNDFNKGKEKEVNFWKDWFVRKGYIFQGDHKLSGLFDFMIGDKKEVKIANLGAGAINTIGNKRDGVKVEIVASDFLANEYNQIWKELNIQSPVPIGQQDMTHLTYKDNEFDIVYCVNALDHCSDPRKALEEMIRVCKPDGYVYLWHHAHEGRRLGYTGLHKWNLDSTDNGDCKLWNKEGIDTFLLSEVYPGFTNQLKIGNRCSYITSFVKKRGEVKKMKEPDLTAIYYTANHLEETNPTFLKHIEDQLLKALDGLPLIIVSQKPKMLGDNCTNICIGEVGRSHLNIYRQLMIGARAAKTKYIASVEDDMLYSWEHFHTKRPSRDDVFLYNMNRWSVFTWSEPPIYSYRIGRKVVNALIAPRQYIVDAMEERFNKFPDESKIDLSRWGDPGRYEKRLGVT